MELACNITIILPIDIIGSEGTSMRFVPYRQFCYKEKIKKLVCCHLALGKTVEEFYVVELMEQDYHISKRNAMPSDYLRDEEEQLSYDERADIYLRESHTKDHKKETLEVIGLDIKAGERTDYNGRWLQELLDKQVE